MAKIISFEKGAGNVSSRFSEVECVYNVGVCEGEKYVAFSTYGSKDRKDKGTASQVLHINKEAAKKLIEILAQEFEM